MLGNPEFAHHGVPGILIQVAMKTIDDRLHGRVQVGQLAGNGFKLRRLSGKLL